MFILSIQGVVKTILILIGAFVLLRFVGQLMIAKRNLEEERILKQNRDRQKKEKEYIEKNKGKIRINPKSSNSKDEYIDFEEV